MIRRRFRPAALLLVAAAAALWTVLAPARLPAGPPDARSEQSVAIGPTTRPGPRGEPRHRTRTLLADKPGAVYEDHLIDADWADADAVRIRADRVTLRHCEIRNGLRDG